VSPGGGEVVIRLSRGGTISGRVVDERGVGLGAVFVCALADGGNMNLPGGRSAAMTGEDGSFTLERLGDYDFALRAGGGNSKYMPSPAPGKATPGETGILITVRPGVTLSGTLVGSDGTGVQVQALRARPDTGGDGLSTAWSQVKNDGSFTFSGLAPGKYKLTAWVGNGWKELGSCDAPQEGVVVSVPD
jgi:hypothetical protein